MRRKWVLFCYYSNFCNLEALFVRCKQVWRLFFNMRYHGYFRLGSQAVFDLVVAEFGGGPINVHIEICRPACALSVCAGHFKHPSGKGLLKGGK